MFEWLVPLLQPKDRCNEIPAGHFNPPPYLLLTSEFDHPESESEAGPLNQRSDER